MAAKIIPQIDLIKLRICQNAFLCKSDTQYLINYQQNHNFSPRTETTMLKFKLNHNTICLMSSKSMAFNKKLK